MSVTNVRVVSVFLITVALIAGMAVCISHLPPLHNPEIRDWHDLDAMRYHLDKSFILMNNLDAGTAGYGKSASRTAHKGRGWLPIGTSDNPFTGSFDGQGHQISDVFINRFVVSFDSQGHVIVDMSVNRPDESSVGLFGVVGEQGVIQNVGVVNVAVTGTLPGGFESYFLVGENQGPVGSLVGENRGTVKNSYCSGSVAGYWLVGGLVGDNLGTVSNSHFTGNVTDNLAHRRRVTSKDAGSALQASCNNSSVPCSISLVSPPFGDANVPRRNVGFSWDLQADADAFNWVLSDNAALSSPIDTRMGLMSKACMYAGTLDFDTDYYWQVTAVKGGVEICRSPIGIFHTSPPTDVITSSSDVGGLVGYNHGTVSGSCFSGSVVGSNAVGGLAGGSNGTVTDSYSTVSLNGDWFVGGLAGVNLGTVKDCCSGSSVAGHWKVGGLVGENQGDVSNCYSSGNVTGDMAVGGLVGYIVLGTISNSYSTSNVAGYANIGGLVGLRTDEAVVSNSFWDTQAAGQATSGGGMGKMTAEMKDIVIFSDARWNIVSVANPDTCNPAYIWNIVDGETYPFLSWESVS